ncbi:hypothetical protein [Paenibacillus xylanexedens]|uniref:hypothetical protein n=1 Tax=Paenibacillus xylanexedens TaxID=528191 RepID=UPI0011A248A9|nr:hypothetical protein [Paenibacillus xylanexedens]
MTIRKNERVRPISENTIAYLIEEFGFSDDFVKGILVEEFFVYWSNHELTTDKRKQYHHCDIDCFFRNHKILFERFYPNIDLETVIVEEVVQNVRKILTEKRTCLQFAHQHGYHLSAVKAELMRNQHIKSKNKAYYYPRVDDWKEINVEDIEYLLRAVPKREELCRKYKIDPQRIEIMSDYMLEQYIRFKTSKRPMATRYAYGRTPNASLGKSGVGKEHKNVPPESR